MHSQSKILYFKKILFSLILITFFLIPYLLQAATPPATPTTSAPVNAPEKTAAKKDATIQLSVPILNFTEAADIAVYIKAVYQAATYIIVPIVIVVIILGGIEWLAAAGRDPEGMNKAKTRIFHGLIGLGIILLSYLLLELVGITKLISPNPEYIAEQTICLSGGTGGGGTGGAMPSTGISYKKVGGANVIEIDPAYFDIKAMSAKTMIEDIGNQTCATSTGYCGPTNGGCYGNIAEIKQQVPQLNIAAAMNSQFFDCKNLAQLSASDLPSYIKYGRPAGDYVENGMLVKGKTWAGGLYYIVENGIAKIINSFSYSASISSALKGITIGAQASCGNLSLLCITSAGKIKFIAGSVCSTAIKGQEDCAQIMSLDSGGSTQYYYNFNGETHSSATGGREVASFVVAVPKGGSSGGGGGTTCTSGGAGGFVVVSDVHEGQSFSTDTLAASIAKFSPSYIIINGDLIMKGGSYCGGTDPTQCYSTFYNKFKSLNIPIIVTPGNHDHSQAAPYFHQGITQAGSDALVTLDYLNSSSFSGSLSGYNNVFVFQHTPFINCSGCKDGGTYTLSSGFKEELKKLNGKCALIAGHSHIYLTQKDPATGCLFVSDGNAGGDLRDQGVSYTLVQSTQSGFKVCAIKQANNFNLNDSDCVNQP